MKFDKTNIKSLIQEVTDKWSYSGFFTLYGQGEKLFGGSYGFENRDIGKKTNENTRYLLDAQDMFFAKLSLLMEVSGGNIKLSDKIAKYIPELKHGEKITIRNLLKNESGIFDYYHSHLMVQFENNDELKGLPEVAAQDN